MSENIEEMSLCDRAKKYYLENKVEESLSELIRGFSENADDQELYAVAVLCLERLGAFEESNLFRNAVTEFDKYEPFYNLGRYYLEVHHPKMAIAFLERAMRLSNNLCIVAAELSIAYNENMEVKKALATLEKSDIKDDYWSVFQYYWCILLNGKIDGVRRFIRESQDLLLHIEDEKLHQTIELAVSKLDECYERFRLLKTVRPLIMDWHFIQYGAAILDLFDDRVVEDGLDIAGGRWVAKYGNYEEIKLIMQKLAQYIEKMEINIEKIYYTDNEDSEILAKVASIILKLDIEKYNKDLDTQNSLIIAGNSNDFEQSYELITIKKNQLVFALNQSWFSAAVITPDVCGFISQMFVYPWTDGALKIDEETNEVTAVKKDTRSATEIAEFIMTENDTKDERFEENLMYYVSKKEYMKVGVAGTKRLGYVVDSPISGAYFS